MARYPEASWRPLAGNWAAQPALKRYDLIILHTMAGSLSGTESWFKRDGYGSEEAHFGVGFDGTTYQWQDTSRQAEANGAANLRAISIETADLGTGFPKWNLNDGNAVPPWTKSQVERLGHLIAWLSKIHGIPCDPVVDSKPTRRGVGYHRLGVPGVAVKGGELWSSSRGKTCPGKNRIAQMPAVIERARFFRGVTDSPVLVPPTAKSRGDVVLENYRVQGAGNIRLNFPVGSTSGVISKGWVSASVDGSATGSAQVFFQSDAGGISDVSWSIPFKNGHSARRWADVPNGTTMININYNFPDGGCITLEGAPK